MDDIKYKTSYIKNSVKEDFLQFLFKCYTKIPYRNSNNEIRNIPFIVLHTSRNIEDNFLMFYRFIECYYKQQPIKDIKSSFIRYSIENNYKDKEKILNVENLEREIICLRNHYVHNGYHISNQKLYISFPKIGKKANPKNYRADNVNFDWIYLKICYNMIIMNLINTSDQEKSSTNYKYYFYLSCSSTHLANSSLVIFPEQTSLYICFPIFLYCSKSF